MITLIRFGQVKIGSYGHDKALFISTEVVLIIDVTFGDCFAVKYKMSLKLSYC